MDALQNILAVVGTVALGGGALAVAVYQVFKHLAAKWLDARFEERLQSIKHQHDQEIESLRFKIATLLDRTVKLHQHEFEVLPEAWAKLSDAFWQVRTFISPMQSYPDLDSMTRAQLAEFVAKSNLLDWQKSELLQTEKDRTRLYIKQIYWHNMADAQSTCRVGYTFLMKSGIFIDRNIYKGLVELHDLVWNALIEHKVNEESQAVPRDSVHGVKLRTRGDELMKELEEMIHQRLWSVDNTIGAEKIER